MTDATLIGDVHDVAMTPNGRHPRRPSDEQRAFFDAIIDLRTWYATRGADDATPVIGLRHAIAGANAAMLDAPSNPALRPGIAGN